jgi:microcystin-dependent protein
MAEPAGIVMPFAGSTAPEGYLLCDGSAVSRSDYATLFGVIGTTYGAGDGSTTFNVPDLSGRVVIGVSGSHALASTGGSETVTLSASELPAHSHEVPQHGHADDITATTPVLSHSVTQAVFKYNSPNRNNSTSGSSRTVYNSTNTPAASRATNVAVGAHAAADCTVEGSVDDCAAFDTGLVGGGNGHNNMQPFVSITYIISTGE